jgi:hypothetical protein
MQAKILSSTGKLGTCNIKMHAEILLHSYPHTFLAKSPLCELNDSFQKDELKIYFY